MSKSGKDRHLRGQGRVVRMQFRRKRSRPRDERVHQTTMPIIFTHTTLGWAMADVLATNTGAKCPHGCSGCAARLYGLVSHLVERHGYSEKRAWKKAREWAD